MVFCLVLEHVGLLLGAFWLERSKEQFYEMETKILFENVAQVDIKDRFKELLTAGERAHLLSIDAFARALENQDMH